MNQGREASAMHHEIFDLCIPMLEYDRSALGKEFGEFAPTVMRVLEYLNASGPPMHELLARELLREKKLVMRIDGREVVLRRDTHIHLGWVPREGYVDGADGDVRVLIDTRIDDDLEQEGLVREFIHQVQRCRKEAGLSVSDCIELHYEADQDVQRAIETFARHIQEETLAVALRSPIGDVAFRKDIHINEHLVQVGIRRTQ